MLKSLRLVGWMVGLGSRLRLCLCLGFLVWLFFWSWLKLLVFGLRVVCFGMAGCLGLVVLMRETLARPLWEI